MTADNGPGVPARGRWWRSPPRLELAAIAVFVLFVAAPFLHRSQVVLSFDGLAYSGPNLQVTLDAIRDGHLPLWNEWIFGGVTHAGNPQTGFWYLPLLFGLPFSTTRALNVLTLAHLLLLASGMVALCRWRLRLRPPATFVGTVALLGCGAVATKTIQFEQLLVISWVPLLLALVHWTITSPRPWRASACLALATGGWLTAGHPQIQYLTAPLLVVWTAALVVDHRASRRLPTVAAGAVAGASIAAPHLLLALRATRSSALDSGRTLDDVRSLGWLPGRDLVPGLLGRPLATDHAALVHGFEQTTYVGAAVAVLAVLGVATGVLHAGRRAVTIGLGLVAALSLTLAVGPVTPVFRVAFGAVPGFDLGRVAARWVLPASMCLALLAALGVEAARSNSRRERWAGVAGCGVAATSSTAAIVAYAQELPGWRTVAAWVAVAAVTVGAWWAVGWAVGAEPGRPRRRRLRRWRDRSGWVLLLVPALLVAGELGLAARHSYARDVLSANAPETAGNETLDLLLAGTGGRVIPLTFDELGDPGYLAPALRPNVNATLGIPSVDGYDGGVQVTERWVQVFGTVLGDFDPELTLRAQFRGQIDPASWARFGVRYVLIDRRGIGAQWLGGWSGPVATGESFALYENPRWRGPAVAWFSTIAVSAPNEAAAAVVDDPGGQSAAVETDGPAGEDAAPVDVSDPGLADPGDPATGGSDDAGEPGGDVDPADPSDPGGPTGALDAADLTCALDDCTPVALTLDRPHTGELHVATDLAAPALVAVQQQFDEGWHATVDGRAAEVVAVDGMQIGVAVPAGRHEVRFTYHPAGLTATIAISLAATAAALALLVPPSLLPGRRRRGSAEFAVVASST